MLAVNSNRSLLGLGLLCAVLACQKKERSYESNTAGTAGDGGFAGDASSTGGVQSGGKSSTGGRSGTGGTARVSSVLQGGGTSIGGTTSLPTTTTVGGATSIGGSSATPTCEETHIYCAASSSCINPETDVKNCGSCGHACGALSSCSVGKCQAASLLTGLSGAQGMDVSIDGLFYAVDNSLQRCTVPASCAATTTQIGSVGSVSMLTVTKTLSTNLIVFQGKGKPMDKYPGFHYCPVSGCNGAPVMIDTVPNTGYIGGLVVADGDIYYHKMYIGSDYTTSYLYRVPGNSTGAVDASVTIADQLELSTPVAVDAKYAYFVRTDSTGINPSVVGCDRFTGCKSYTSMFLGSIAQIAAADGKLYWMEGITLWRCNANDPSSATNVATLSSDIGGEMVIAGTNLYWLTNNNIQYCTLPSCTGGAKTLVSNLSNASTLRVYGGYVYWLVRSDVGSPTGAIYRVAAP